MGSSAAAKRWTPSLGLLDRSAVLLSNACALHCALTPLLVSIAPFAATEGFDSALRRTLLAFGLLGVGFGCWLHRNMKTLVPLGLALALAAVLELAGWRGQREVLASLGISGLLIVAHTLNATACTKLCDHCSAGHWWADRVLALGKRSGLSSWALPLSGAVLAHSLVFTLLAPAVGEVPSSRVAAMSQRAHDHAVDLAATPPAPRAARTRAPVPRTPRHLGVEAPRPVAQHTASMR